jgi:ABC-type Mn2+/Zn2+ transport system ATPase subunit
MSPGGATNGGSGGALLRTKGLGASIGGRALFRGIDLEVRPGQLVAVTGVNGSGKSTLLRILLGLRRADEGTVERAPDLTVGYVPQLDPADPGLPFPALSIVDQGLPRARFSPRAFREARGAALDALHRVGFAAPPRRRYDHLSGGERRRVLLARALARKPNLLALDEPTAGVDVDGTAEFLRMIEIEVRERGAAAVWVCHGLAAVEAAADRVLHLGGDL